MAKGTPEKHENRNSRGRRVTVEALKPTNREKRIALGVLKNHVERNWEYVYSGLSGASPEQIAESLAFMREPTILTTKRKLRKAHVIKPEATYAIVDLFNGRGRRLNWSVPESEKKDYAVEIYDFINSIREPRRPSRQHLSR